MRSHRGVVSCPHTFAEGVQRLFEEFRSSTESQRLLVGDTIARIVDLQSFVVDQVTLFYSYIFYVAALVVATLITSTKRSVRVGQLIILLLCFTTTPFTMKFTAPLTFSTPTTSFSVLF
jgi:hypothetical protein